ncbi:MraY family glycosyltransferase [Halarsenatibacter silvermanii]|uniref:UDP-GlcNAc:undecaprenyl-phosphate GlcNAc-1-phosphate transferase n=1 Tax=Halarsenatibacter silvermanii TaxID=321763 RepID=A0A1G9HW35_9FIRM|nr:MraY family glycosyltransferase [Halarsenatibacter silvermanii]SDL17188.1 UDP-GlcNAc:undecaprenyl-phosphate GlcNAc-1-phosphate transferase [Halarsenatibacter silvermanii]
MAYLSVLLISLGITYLLTPAVRELAHRLEAVDEPSRRRINIRRVPNLGGLAVYFGFTLALLQSQGVGRDVRGLLVGGSLILLLGTADDLRPIPPMGKFLGQLLAAAALIPFGISIDFITNPLTGGMIHLGLLSIPFTLLWVVSIVNAINLIDGLDGLAAGISAIAAVTLFAVSLQEGQAASALMMLALGGSTLAFLRYNFHPAQIFLGDGGSMLLGYLLAAISILGALKSAAAVTVLVPLLVLGIPIFDTVYAIVRRFYNSRPISQADHGHLHHRLLALGWTQRQVAFIVYLISVFLGVLAVLVNSLKFHRGLLVILIAASFLIYGFWRLGVFSVEIPRDGRKLSREGRQQEMNK